MVRVLVKKLHSNWLKGNLLSYKQNVRGKRVVQCSAFEQYGFEPLRVAGIWCSWYKSVPTICQRNLGEGGGGGIEGLKTPKCLVLSRNICWSKRPACDLEQIIYIFRYHDPFVVFVQVPVTSLCYSYQKRSSDLWHWPAIKQVDTI